IQNPIIVQNIQGVYAGPLADPKITGVSSYLEGDDEATRVRVTKGDVPALEESSAPPGPEARVESNTSIVLLGLKRVAMDGDRRNWSFHRGNKTVVNATIRDNEFLARVARGEIRFGSADLLKVELLETQRAEQGEIRSTYEVLRVIEHVRGRPELPGMG